MAKDALFSARKWLSVKIPSITSQRMLDDPPSDVIWDSTVDPSIRLALLGRYGNDAPRLVANAKTDEFKFIDQCQTSWAEIRWAAQSEGVIHLDDLLMRRVRIGLTLPEGGIPWLENIRRIVQSELEWDDHRWKQECDSYIDLWKRSYSLPSHLGNKTKT
jgi:glycerol-3-phosphate dehydrogenase